MNLKFVSFIVSYIHTLIISLNSIALNCAFTF